jgi:hypothetical protein
MCVDLQRSILSTKVNVYMDFLTLERKDVVSSFIHEILRSCANPIVEISQTALDVLAVFASLYEKLAATDSVSSIH